MKYLFVLLILAGCAYRADPNDFRGNTCISEGMYEGDKLRHLETGKIGTVKRVYGETPRCSAEGHSRLADVEYE